ncbi:zinc finger protein 395 [Bemisia tabaci]|uniref:zinc finger protein 395 n=1 Tax=Bemisia tabaci TaxID=7038 RepID=UPI0008F9C797|nr:PREDICTED: zinc finger protein 395 isoform X2 [Bemisia tabaci]
MSTGKRLAKRSIIGTRVCAPGEDGKFYAGVIHAVKTPAVSVLGDVSGSNAETRYSVRFDADRKTGTVCRREYRDVELIGPGFQSISNFHLVPGQKVFLTFNGREICGEVVEHKPQIDEVTISVQPQGHEGTLELKKKLEEIRLLESRKSARLMDQDTDFARLADMAGDRKRSSSHSIDVPSVYGSRKRRTHVGVQEDMNECTAALVLMSLSCSPHSPSYGMGWEPLSPSPSHSDGFSWRSATPSPPLSEGEQNAWTPPQSSSLDEGIVLDDEFDDLPKRKKVCGSPTTCKTLVPVTAGENASRVVFQCTWPGCLAVTATCQAIETHVRQTHLGPKTGTSVDGDYDLDDHEEEFYYTEVEVQQSPPPTLSHRDMARPPHEDPEYQRAIQSHHNYASPISIPYSNGHVAWSFSNTSPNSVQKHMKLSYSALPAKLLPTSPTRKVRGETKKCRKVYGMEHRELWCTQCKWKKACTRFSD